MNLCKQATLISRLSKITTDNSVPFRILKTEIPARAEKQDMYYFYFRFPAFMELCQPFYDIDATAKLLHELNLLKCRSDSFSYPAKPKLFGDKCPLVYAVKKSIVDSDCDE